jgi:hypothetical protein
LNAASLQGDQIGRFFADWAIFESPWRIFEQIKEPKNWVIFNHYYQGDQIGQNFTIWAIFMALGKFFS